jgi:hypothetical protein
MGMATSVEEALKKIKNFKEDEIEWQSNPLKGDRVTYEVYTRSDKDSGK